MEAQPIKKTTKRKPAPKPAPSLNMYRRIAVTFVAATFLTLAVVVYLSFSRATIRIVPEARAVSTTFVADVVATPVEETDVAGTVVSNVFEQASEATLEGGDGTKKVEGKAGGMVTIYNNTDSAQPLVATTRLLTADGVLFRIDSGVTAPAQGSVQVMAHADVVGVSGDIGPSRFTIPGLNATLQSSIYAESTEAFVGGLVEVRVVSEADLDVVAAALQEEMLNAAKETLRLQAGGTYSGEAFFTEVMEKKTDTPPGTESGIVSVSLKLKIAAVFYQKEDLFALAQGKLYEQMASGMEVAAVSADAMVVVVDNYDLETQIANVGVTLEGDATLSPTNKLLDKQQFVGRSANEVKVALESSDAIKSVNITFVPFWLRRLPTLKDHIKIAIE